MALLPSRDLLTASSLSYVALSLISHSSWPLLEQIVVYAFVQKHRNRVRCNLLAPSLLGVSDQSLRCGESMPCLRSCLCYWSKAKKVSSDKEEAGARLDCKLSLLMEIISICIYISEINRGTQRVFAASFLQLFKHLFPYKIKKGGITSYVYATSLALLALSIPLP